jgi:hypothetical protein
MPQASHSDKLGEMTATIAALERQLAEERERNEAAVVRRRDVV